MQLTLNDFAYLREMAAKYGTLYFAHEFDRFATELTDQQRAELSNCYEEIDRKKEAARLSRWIDHHAATKPGVSYQERQFAQQMGQLFCLFAFLRDCGIVPFSDGRVSYVAQPKVPRWENLPPELHYLREVTEQYGIHPTEARMIDFLKDANERDWEILASTAEQVRINGHYAVFLEWLKTHPLNENEEGWRTYCLFGLLDHASLQFE